MSNAIDRKPTTQSSIKTATAKPSRRRGRVPGYAHVLGLVQDDESRSLALEVFRRGGGQRDRWTSSDWAAMAEGITRVEDMWELNYPRRDRTPLRNARRALEDATDL